MSKHDGESFRVVHKRVAVRALPSTTAEIVGVEALGAVISGKRVQVKGELWVRRDLNNRETWMLVDGSRLGLGRLLEAITVPSAPPPVKSEKREAKSSTSTASNPSASTQKVPIGLIGERLWHSPLHELPRPEWAPRHGYYALSGGLSATGWRNIWVFGGIIPGLGYSDDVWRTVNGGASWELVVAGIHWSPRSDFGCCGGSTAPEPRPKGVIYIVGGQGGPGLLPDVWASDTAGRKWSRMCEKAPFGSRTGVACATVPSRPLVLLVAGGVSDDVHRDLWVSQDGGATFDCLMLTMPIGPTLMKWPPHLLCAARAQSGQLGLWCLRLRGLTDPLEDTSKSRFCQRGDEVNGLVAELEPLDEFSQSFDCECSPDFPKPPRVGLDLEASVAVHLSRHGLQGQCLPNPEVPDSISMAMDCSPWELEKVSCVAPPESFVVCDMDAAYTRGHGKVHILTEDRCFTSDRCQYKLQDRFLKLVGLRLAATVGLPMDLWLGRVRPLLLPRPRRIAGFARPLGEAPKPLP